MARGRYTILLMTRIVLIMLSVAGLLLGGCAKPKPRPIANVHVPYTDKHGNRKEVSVIVNDQGVHVRTSKAKVDVNVDID